MAARRTVEDDQKTLSRIIYSDAAQILHILPACDTLRFKLDASSSESILDLCVGECGDSKVWVSSTGSVRKIVFRESAIRKVGQIFEVRKPLGQHFKAIEPFKWAPTLRDGICSPMATFTHAIVLMYMHIWAEKKLKASLSLPPLVYEDLYTALVTSRTAIEKDRLLPKKLRLVPQDAYDKLIDFEREDESSEAPDSPQVPPTPDTPNMIAFQHHVFGQQEYRQKEDSPMVETPDPEGSMCVSVPHRQEQPLPVTVTRDNSVVPQTSKPPQPIVDISPPVQPGNIKMPLSPSVPSNISPSHQASAQALMLRLYGHIPGS